VTMFRLDGKAALVTGASGGIGAAIARALYGQGAVVALSGTRRDALDALGADLGERAFVCPADLRDAAEPDALVEAAEGAAGPLAILVNNAGMTRDTLALRMSDADWQAVLDVDLSAPFRLARAALRGMLRRRVGRIINIASIVGATGNAGQVNYAAAKAGQGVGTGGRLARHHRERRGAWLRRHGDDRSAVRAAARQADRIDPAAADRQAGGRGRRGGLSGVR